jgi:hypothetical protein
LKRCSLDCKTGGYNFEGTSLKENRLINIILLVTLAYSSAVFQGTEIQKKRVKKNMYLARRNQEKKYRRRRSIFSVGLDGEQWVNYLDKYSERVQELMKLTRNKRRFYQLGIWAATIMKSTF